MAAWVVRKCRFSSKWRAKPEASKYLHLFFSVSLFQMVIWGMQILLLECCNLLILLVLMVPAGLKHLQNTVWLTVFLLLQQKYGVNLLLLVLYIGGLECWEGRESFFFWGDILSFLWSCLYSPGSFWQINSRKERISSWKCKCLPSRYNKYWCTRSIFAAWLLCGYRLY